MKNLIYSLRYVISIVLSILVACFILSLVGCGTLSDTDNQMLDREYKRHKDHQQTQPYDGGTNVSR